MATPLALLGDAIARGTGQIAAIRLSDRDAERRRQQQLEDYERQRGDAIMDYERRLGDQRADTHAAREYEASTYQRRRLDRIVDELISHGLLAASDVDKPDAIDAALRRIPSPEARRNIEEMAAYKAALPKILEAVGDIEGVGLVLGADPMNPQSVQSAREVMSRAYSALGARASQDRDRFLDNAKNAAGAFVAQMAKQSEIELAIEADDEVLEKIASGEYDADLLGPARQRAARALFPGKSEIQLRPEERAQVEARAAEEVQQERFMRQTQVERRRESRIRQLNAAQRGVGYIAELSRAGAFSFLPDAASGAVAPTADGGAATPRALMVDETDQFLDSDLPPAPSATPAALMSPGQSQVPPPAPSIPSASTPPAILGPEQQGPSFFGRDRDNTLNRQRVANAITSFARTIPPAIESGLAERVDVMRGAAGLFQPSNWSRGPSVLDGSPSVFVFGQTPEYVARLRDRASRMPAGTAAQRRLLEQADQIERSLSQRETQRANALLGIGNGAFTSPAPAPASPLSATPPAILGPQ